MTQWESASTPRLHLMSRYRQLAAQARSTMFVRVHVISRLYIWPLFYLSRVAMDSVVAE